MGNRSFDTRRLETFSDAVLAVAITLMVLRIDPPEAGAGKTLGEAFADETIPAVIYFLITFAVIVILWTQHHDIFRDLPERTAILPFWLNMGFLAAVCLLPFGLEFFTAEPTSYLTVSVYAGFMAVATLLLGSIARVTYGRWSMDAITTAVIFLLAIPFASVLGGWCLFIWWLDAPIGWWRRYRGARTA